MSMRQGRGGDLCNRGDPPSNMTAHRYQPSPNIKWTRLPFSHEHKSFPKPPPQCVCVPERSSWFSRGRGEAICEGKGSSTLHRHRARSSSRDRWPPPSTPLHGMALLQKTSKWEYGGWKQMLFTQTIRVKSCVIFILAVNLKKTHTFSLAKTVSLLWWCTEHHIQKPLTGKVAVWVSLHLLGKLGWNVACQISCEMLSSDCVDLSARVSLPHWTCL